MTTNKDIKTWQERAAELPLSERIDERAFMRAEIAELRAALATTAPTVAVDECPCCESKAVMLSHTCRDCGAEYATHGDVTANASSPKPASVAIQEGWALVPVEPTPKMVDATFNEAIEGLSHNRRNKHIYRAMLAAAPSPADQKG